MKKIRDIFHVTLFVLVGFAGTAIVISDKYQSVAEDAIGRLVFSVVDAADPLALFFAVPLAVSLAVLAALLPFFVLLVVVYPFVWITTTKEEMERGKEVDREARRRYREQRRQELLEISRQHRV